MPVCPCSSMRLPYLHMDVEKHIIWRLAGRRDAMATNARTLGHPHVHPPVNNQKTGKEGLGIQQLSKHLYGASIKRECRLTRMLSVLNVRRRVCITTIENHGPYTFACSRDQLGTFYRESVCHVS